MTCIYCISDDTSVLLSTKRELEKQQLIDDAVSEVSSTDTTSNSENQKNVPASPPTIKSTHFNDDALESSSTITGDSEIQKNVPASTSKSTPKSRSKKQLNDEVLESSLIDITSESEIPKHEPESTSKSTSRTQSRTQSRTKTQLVIDLSNDEGELLMLRV